MISSGSGTQNSIINNQYASNKESNLGINMTVNDKIPQNQKIKGKHSKKTIKKTKKTKKSFIQTIFNS